MSDSPELYAAGLYAVNVYREACVHHRNTQVNANCYETGKYILIFLNFSVTQAKRKEGPEAGLLVRQKATHRLCFADCAKAQPTSKRKKAIYMYILKPQQGALSKAQIHYFIIRLMFWLPLSLLHCSTLSHHFRFFPRRDLIVFA